MPFLLSRPPSELIDRLGRSNAVMPDAHSLSKKMFEVMRPMEDVEDTYSIWKRTIENQIILKVLHPKRTQIAQPLMRKFPCATHARHPGQFLKSGVSGF
jgi:hypothetical protein